MPFWRNETSPTGDPKHVEDTNTKMMARLVEQGVFMSASTHASRAGNAFRLCRIIASASGGPFTLHCYPERISGGFRDLQSFQTKETFLHDIKGGCNGQMDKTNHHHSSGRIDRLIVRMVSTRNANRQVPGWWWGVGLFQCQVRQGLTPQSRQYEAHHRSENEWVISKKFSSANT